MPNKNRAEIGKQQLHMTVGAAAHKLKKSIIYNFVINSLEFKYCYVCKEEFITIDNFSIEHKKPWLYEENAKELFFDLNNIAFSHMTCNKPRTNTIRFKKAHKERRITSPEGMNWCSYHKEFLPIENFRKDKNKWTGLHHHCKQCEIKYKVKNREKNKLMMREYRQNNPLYVEKNREQSKQRHKLK